MKRNIYVAQQEKAGVNTEDVILTHKQKELVKKRKKERERNTVKARVLPPQSPFGLGEA